SYTTALKKKQIVEYGYTDTSTSDYEEDREVAAELHARLTAAGLEAVRPDAAVVSVRAPSPEQAVRWAADCRTAGLAVGCFRPPSVPDGISRLRLTARADLSGAEIERAVRVIGKTRP
ncbi:aminotransferase class I/II-fold pyridoxal phosphate-dependent enzyme, partial [Streptomyces sp. 900105755]